MPTKNGLYDTWKMTGSYYGLDAYYETKPYADRSVQRLFLRKVWRMHDRYLFTPMFDFSNAFLFHRTLKELMEMLYQFCVANPYREVVHSEWKLLNKDSMLSWRYFYEDFLVLFQGFRTELTLQLKQAAELNASPKALKLEDEDAARAMQQVLKTIVLVKNILGFCAVMLEKALPFAVQEMPKSRSYLKQCAVYLKTQYAAVVESPVLETVEPVEKKEPIRNIIGQTPQQVKQMSMRSEHIKAFHNIEKTITALMGKLKKEVEGKAGFRVKLFHNKDKKKVKLIFFESLLKKIRRAIFDDMTASACRDDAAVIRVLLRERIAQLVHEALLPLQKDEKEIVLAGGLSRFGSCRTYSFLSHLMSGSQYLEKHELTATRKAQRISITLSSDFELTTLLSVCGLEEKETDLALYPVL